MLRVFRHFKSLARRFAPHTFVFPDSLSLEMTDCFDAPVGHADRGNFKNVTQQVTPLSLKAGEPVYVRVFLDRSIIEVFVNEPQCRTQRIYPARKDSLSFKVFTRDGEMKVKSLEAWDSIPVL